MTQAFDAEAVQLGLQDGGRLFVAWLLTFARRHVASGMDHFWRCRFRGTSESKSLIRSNMTRDKVSELMSFQRVTLRSARR